MNASFEESKKLTQSSLNNFFKLSKIPESVPDISIKKSKRPSKFAAMIKINLEAHINSEHKSSGEDKRKLAAPIFSSDDSDDESDKGHENIVNESDTTTVIKANKTPQKSPLKSNKLKISTPQKFVNEIDDRPKKVANFQSLNIFRNFFLNILKTENLKNLVNSEDRTLLHNFFNLNENYQFTCIKLFLWKPIWYNIFNYVNQIGLEMSEDEIVKMYNCIKKNHLVETDYKSQEDINTLLNLLTMTDLKKIHHDFKLPKCINKKDVIITKLLKNCKSQQTLTPQKSTLDILIDCIERRMGLCIKLSEKMRRCLYHVFLLNTFTNSMYLKPQDYFLNIHHVDVDHRPFSVEDYQIFDSSEDFQQYAEAMLLRCTVEEAIEKKNLEKILDICRSVFRKLSLNPKKFNSNKLKYLEKFTAKGQYIIILNYGSKHLMSTNHKEVKEWFEFLLSQDYASHRRGYWYCTLASIWTNYLKNYSLCANLIMSALDNDKANLSDIQLQELASKGHLLYRKTYKLDKSLLNRIAAKLPTSCDREWPQKVINTKSIRSNEVGKKRKYVDQLDNGEVHYLSVEQKALKYYNDHGYPQGMHCEGRPICTLFTLMFFDIIFESNIKGTFVSPLQCYPLDMFSPLFYENRRNLIEKRLLQVEKEWEIEDIFNLCCKQLEKTCPCQTMSSADIEELFEMFICIGRSIMRKIFERLVRDYKSYHSGFPDLILWNPQDKNAKFVEVKGENDNLSIKQKLWINYLMDIGANVEVCRVDSLGSKKRIKKKSNLN